MGSRVLISMPDQFLQEIDTLAQNENRTRSELIREALRRYIKHNNVISSINNETAANGVTNPLKQLL